MFSSIFYVYFLTENSRYLKDLMYFKNFLKLFTCSLLQMLNSNDEESCCTINIITAVYECAYAYNISLT